MLMNRSRSPHCPVSVQQNFKIEDEEDLRHDFERLQQAMEMVGFLSATKKQWVTAHGMFNLHYFKGTTPHFDPLNGCLKGKWVI